MPDIPEEYYYSTLSAEEIEDRLLHMVPYNKSMSLSAEEKALFRANINAGQLNVGFIVLGYFTTLEDMQESLTQLPKAGDAYGIGTESPYDIYVYDGYHKIWVNNGPLDAGDAVIADDQVSTSKTWSSSKINSSFTTLGDNKQNKITANGLLKGNGSGGVSAAVAGTDYLTPATAYSPLKNVTDSNYSIVASDIGKTLAPEYSTLHNVAAIITLPQSVSASFPVGAEIAFFWQHSSSLKIVFSGGARCAKAGDTGFTQNVSYNFPEMYSMVAIKKTGSASAGDFWILQGNVEVVS